MTADCLGPGLFLIVLKSSCDLSCFELSGLNFSCSEFGSLSYTDF